MQIAVVTDRWEPERGGLERYLFELAGAIRNSGHSVDVYCQEGGSAPGGSIHSVSGIRYPRFFREWSFCRKVRRLLAAGPPRPVLAVRPFDGATHYQLHGGVYQVLFEAEREALDSPLRRFLYRPATAANPKRQLLLRMQERILGGKQRPRLMTVSNRVRGQLTRIFGIPSQQVTVLYPGVDLNVFRSAGEGVRESLRQIAGLDRGELMLLFVAHNFALKGLQCLLAAVSEARRTGFRARLLVAGAGPVRAFERIASHLGISRQVTFLGAVGQKRLVELYQAGDALIHPTFYDACSLVALEALACGCPVVTTRNNGVAELMQSDHHGFLLDDPRDIGALAKALHALRDRSRVAGMSRAASLLGQGFDMRAHAAKVMAWIFGNS